MANTDDYLEYNRRAWNARTEVHLQADFYDLPGFLAGKNTLKPIELELLGDIAGCRILHLQCHFGQDTLSLARLGAQVTGVDLSDRAIAAARQLAEQVAPEARFLVSDIYALPEHLDEQFDVVFTSYGVLGWLPDLDRWAGVVARYLRPGGRFVMAEFHPLIWMLDDEMQHFRYPYIQTEPIVEDISRTYTGDADPDLPPVTQVSWNHGLARVITALLDRELQLERFAEFDYSPWNCFPNSVEVAPGRYQIRHLAGIVPLVYALRCTKPEARPQP